MEIHFTARFLADKSAPFAQARTGKPIEATSQRCRPAALSVHFHSEACKAMTDGNSQQIGVELENDTEGKGGTKF